MRAVKSAGGFASATSRCVGSLLGEWSVNVDFMSVAGGPEGRALMALGIGRALDAEERAQLGEIEDVFTVRQIDLT